MADDRSDREQISDVLVRYATGIDTQDWTRFRTCFTPDVKADYGEIGEWHDLDGLTEYMATTHQDMVSTKHMISNIAIDQHGDEATAVSYVHAVLAITEDPPMWVDAVGGYVDRLVRSAEGWRIRAREFRMTRVVMSDPATP